MDAITVEHLTKLYRIYDKPIMRLKEALHPFGRKFHSDFYALNDVSLSVKQGSCTGIIGLNGSGKSTLLQLIAGVLTPTSGRIRVSGRVSALLELGAGFNPEFTGIENIEFQCSIMGYKKREIESVIPSIIEFADIGEFIHHPVKTYSSGMYVRLAFAVAINVDPDILIVDEALAVGDIRFQAKCLEKIQSFRKDGKTLLFVSHDAASVKSLCDHAFLLDKGRLIHQGEPETVFNVYNNLITEKDSEIRRNSDLESESRRYGSQKLTIKNVALTDQYGRAAQTFISGSMVRVTISAIAQENLKEVTFGILFRDRFGHDVFGINNFLLGQKIVEVKSGENFEVTYDFPLNFGDNIYKLTVAAHTGENHVAENFDWINDAIIFRVIHASDFRFAGSNRIHPEFSLKRSCPAHATTC